MVQNGNLNVIWSKAKVEFARVIDLGKKMFVAGRVNTELRDTLSELGLAVYQKEKSADQKSSEQEISNLIKKVDFLSNLMDSHEGEIQKIKNKNPLTQG
jgi:Mn-dependent DtxR family transcriptional regulator